MDASDLITDSLMFVILDCCTGMANNLTLVQQKLSDRLRVSAVSADFDAEKYEACCF